MTTKTRAESGFWLFTEAAQTSCPAIYVLASMPDLRRAYQGGKTFSERLRKLYDSACANSMENCEISNCQYVCLSGDPESGRHTDYCEDYEFSNEGELEAIARELAAVLGHRHF